MQIYFLNFFHSLWYFLNEISIYLVLGLLFAGVLKQIAPENFIKKQLGKESYLSVIKSAVLGIPLPLCSCSVLPFATALKKDGASKGAVQTFLISTPITGVDSILATWGILGFIFTAYRLISSIFISILAGFLTTIFDSKKAKNSFKEIKECCSSKNNNEIKECCSSKNNNEIKECCSSKNNNEIKGCCSSKNNNEIKGCCSSKNNNEIKGCCSSKNNNEIKECCSSKNNTPFYVRVYDYAFNTLLKDIIKPLLIGIVIAVFISTFFSNSFTNFSFKSNFLNYASMLIISLPIYVCATASIPLAVSFLIAGFSPGAVLIFLTAGPASNMATIMIIKKLLGNKSLIIYLFSIITGAIFFGYFLDYFFQDNVFYEVSKQHKESHSSITNIVFTIIFLLLSLKLIIENFTKQKSSCSN